MMSSSKYSDRAGIYLQSIIKEAYRTLGLMDRDSSSVTFGCLDRAHWAWKFTDFPGARFQEGLCVISFLYSSDLNDNPYLKMTNCLAGLPADLISGQR